MTEIRAARQSLSGKGKEKNPDERRD